MNLKIKKLHPNAVVPTYATDGSACFDLYAATVGNASYVGQLLSHGSPVTCGTGLAFEVPEGWAMMVYSRSGHGFKNNTRLSNCVGVIDSDYRGELLVKLTMDDEYLDPEIELEVKQGDRIAQAMLIPIEQVSFEIVDELSETKRGTGGLGSTGK